MAGFALYRFYGDAGVLLYVGITDNPDRRWKEHSKGKNWWPEVRGITIDWYDTRGAVEAAERRAVAVEQPAHNKALRRKVVTLPRPVSIAPAALTLTPQQEDDLESFECAWTAWWWVDPAAVDHSGSPYRHDGRVYATQPHDWRETVLRAQNSLLENGWSPLYLTYLIPLVHKENPNIGPDGIWNELMTQLELVLGLGARV